MLIVHTCEYKACKVEQTSAKPGVRARLLAFFVQLSGERTRSKMYGGASVYSIDNG